MIRKSLWVDRCPTPPWVKLGLKLITLGSLQSRACEIVGSVVRQLSGVAEFDNLSLQRVQHELDPLCDQWRLQKIAASPQTHPGGLTSREAAKIIEPNWSTAREVFDGIEVRRHDNDSSKVELEDATQAKLIGRVAEEEEQSSSIFEQEVTESLRRRHLITEKLVKKAHWVDGRSTPVWMKAGPNLAGQGGLQSGAKYGSRDWSRNSAQRTGITNIDSLGTTSAAIAMFLDRLQHSIPTNSHTYIKALQMCSKQKDLLTARKVHDYAIQTGMDKNLYVAVTLLNVYIRCGALLDARQVFDQLQERSVVTWTNMIAAYAKSDDAESALELFNQMRQKGMQPDEITYLAILKACANPSALKWGKALHLFIRQDGFESDVRVGTALLQMYAKSGSIDEARLVFDRMEKRDLVTWTAMIGGYAEGGHAVEAYQLFLRMRREGFEPDAITYVTILKTSASAGALDWVKEVHGHASKAGLESDMLVGNALVHMYAESGNINDARLIFDRMEKRDVVTWTAMIGGLAQHGCGSEALELFREMTTDGVKPDGTSFVAVLSACCHGGLVNEGRRLFSSMTQSFGMEPENVHYTCMVDLLGRAGHLDEANLFISDMPVEPNVVTWTTLLGACRTYGNVQMGELAAQKLFKLEPSRDATYVLLSNAYAAAGKWENVSLVRTVMEERGVRKEPGRSWIKVDNKVHEFVVGDTAHPEAKAIYTELHKLMERLKAEGYIPDTRLVIRDINEEDKERALCSHSEKLAIAYGLIHIPRGEAIRITKNLRVCPDCHTATKFISKVTGREIIARDAGRFHHFKDGRCSCGDYW